jgi:ribonuclease HII
MRHMKKRPTFHYERKLRQEGYSMIVGVDEAGCGALAGPVVAGAVVLPLNSRLGKLHDSKLLSQKVREELYEQVTQKADAWAAGIVTVEEIFTLGIRPATLLAMQRAIEGVQGADYALIDARTLPDLTIPQQAIIKGDQKIKSIAAASVIAKVTRDRLMEAAGKTWPAYGFEGHKGYGTAAHRAAIAGQGACPIHRLGFKPFTEGV